ncbi:DNA-dependent RNA polymerase domain containing protein [Theileria equi strain WA]|uniref:DNA-directed RNA polymerase n=1 Tax=Theileria equi strain WA TaxID=1537102 RepID=L1LFT7_THEEQ|nr:DNA-dependent RNA polymerase domain containing protein [Theileria equi strain WA]EKX74139.1 DNA-dependent RNA polymerase domain containing protein [Theileria equi strain WA]|eukprot:XP_004833591.1 DNA-dependent RNA polymerase domain containing protein [Theileria equi strain WA]
MPKAGRCYLAQLEALLYRNLGYKCPRKRSHLDMCRHISGLGSRINLLGLPNISLGGPTGTLTQQKRLINSGPLPSTNEHIPVQDSSGTDASAQESEIAEDERGSDATVEPKRDLLEITKEEVRNRGLYIIYWLSTNKFGHIRGMHDKVINLFKRAEKFASLYGFVLMDIRPEDLMKHVESANSLKELFSPEFIEAQKELLYIGKQLPLLKKEEKERFEKQLEDAHNHFNNVVIPTEVALGRFPEKEPTLNPDGSQRRTYIHNVKRQFIIERLGFTEAFKSARVDASNLLEIRPPTDIPALNDICNQWVNDMSEFISRDRSRNEECIIPPQLNEKVLASETVRFALQLMCFPAYASDSKGNMGSFLRRMIQQPASNQVLLVNASVRLGEEISKIYVSTMKELEKEYNIQSSNFSEDDVHEKQDPLANTDENVDNKSLLENPGKKSSFTVTALSGASRARVISNVTNHAGDSLQTVHADGPPVDDFKRWNVRQNAAIGGYLFNALVKSCYVEVDIATALKQENSSFIDEDHPIDNATKRNSDETQKSKRNEKKIFSRIRKSRFDESKVEIPAFVHKILRNGVRTYGTLEMKECCMLKLRDVVARGLINLSALPMICEPKPWVTVSQGGSLILKHYFIRTTNRASFDIRVFDLSNVFSITNSFGKVPWKINAGVLDVLKKLWDADSSVPMRAYLPDKSCLKEKGETKNTSDSKEIYNPKNRWANEEDKVRIANAISECSLFERRIYIAENFIHEQKLYLPASIDFRGRLYPLSPYLNHACDDACRSLLTFSEVRPLGERGLFWLKVHVSNLYGIDKLPFDDRIVWVDNQMSSIEKLVKNPFSDSSQDFWSKAEKPFQFFASACELVSAIHSKDPHKYLSSIPVQQDGSCNGLQHYSALGRDYNGGLSVNLIDTDKPQDVYKKVLLEVISKVTREFQRAPPTSGAVGIANTPYDCAKLCIDHGLLKRKTVKQTVMTICYGVTRMGAIDQIDNKLKDEASLDHLHPYARRRLATYIAGKVFGSIKTIFNEAMNIKKWLDGISSAHTKFNIPVTWISPIGLPCEQPYCKVDSSVLHTEMQAMRIVDLKSAHLDKRRQRMAFPPNFIHSLDASHLMFTAREIFKSCTSFASVHDSYWIHADRVDFMRSELRKGFVNMYKRPILEDLYSTCVRRLGEGVVSEPPDTGKLDIESVLDSQYFFH